VCIVLLNDNVCVCVCEEVHHHPPPPHGTMHCAFASGATVLHSVTVAVIIRMYTYITYCTIFPPELNDIRWKQWRGVNVFDDVAEQWLQPELMCALFAFTQRYRAPTLSGRPTRVTATDITARHLRGVYPFMPNSIAAFVAYPVITTMLCFSHLP